MFPNDEARDFPMREMRPINFHPSVTIPRMKSLSLDETFDGWQTAARLDGFCVTTSISSPTNSVTAYLGHDGINLYVGFRCSNDDLVAKATGRQNPVYSDDDVELLVQPAGNKQTFHFLTNVLGGQYDLIHDSGEGIPGWQAVGKRGEKEWIVQLAIPFKALGVTAPKPGDTWRILLGRGDRNKTGGGQNATGPPIPVPAFYSPNHFAPAVLGD